MQTKIKATVLLTHEIHPEAMKLLESSVEKVVLAPADDRDTISRMVDDSIDAMIVRYHVLVDRDLLEKGHHLKVVARHSVGTELVDLAAATEFGVYVTNTPTSNTISVAEHALAFILMLAKKLAYADSQLREGYYEVKDHYAPDDLEGKSLGLIGFGRIGRELAKRCQAFGMEVLAFDSYADAAVFTSNHVRRCQELKELLNTADFISIHVPLTPETRHLIGRNELAQMKRTAYLINCSRGSIIDESALAEFLKENKIAGAALDVFEKEPPELSDELFRQKNLLVTPHKAGVTAGSVRRMSMDAVNQVLMALRGEIPSALVNRDVLNRHT